MIRYAYFLLLLVLREAIAQVVDYGVDCSFPIHHTDFKCGDMLGNRKTVYEVYMQGCRDFYGKRGNRCDSTEKDRLEMSLRQPQSMVNYTSTGFMKIRAPKEVQELLFNHWEANNHLREQEVWGVGNIYSNHWVSPTYMVSVENTKLRGAGSRLKEKIWAAAKSTIEQWTGMELRPTSVSSVSLEAASTAIVHLRHHRLTADVRCSHLHGGRDLESACGSPAFSELLHYQCSARCRRGLALGSH
jgi:hypothetical protein